MITNAKESRAGFTLIELSIVLVIIGLIVGGILVGQDMIEAATLRAQITQIEKLNTSVHTFQIKYSGAIPGDMNSGLASQFGFTARAGDAGRGDGNGILQGYRTSSGQPGGGFQMAGETPMFWVDLTTANLIDGSFSTAQPDTGPAGVTEAELPLYYPRAKIGRGSYISVWSVQANPTGLTRGFNYYNIAATKALGDMWVTASAGLTANEASHIDMKTDDGLPTTGRILTFYLHMWGYWPVSSNQLPAAFPASAGSCIDNGNVSGAPYTYTLSYGGNAVACALSIRFQ